MATLLSPQLFTGNILKRNHYNPQDVHRSISLIARISLNVKQLISKLGIKCGTASVNIRPLLAIAMGKYIHAKKKIRHRISCTEQFYIY